MRVGLIREEEEENASALGGFNLDNLSSSSHFREAQAEKQAFWVIIETKLAKQEQQVICPEWCTLLPRYEIRKGLLYRVKQGENKGQELSQLLMLCLFRIPLLKLVHDSPLGGYSGQDKTKARLTTWCFRARLTKKYPPAHTSLTKLLIG